MTHGFTALRLARRVDAERQGDVLATLGIVLAFAGRTADGLRRFDEAVPLTPASKLPRLLHRRAHVLHMLARNIEALEQLAQAIAGSHALGDTLWEGRSLNTRCDVHLALGNVDAAEADAVLAERLLTSVGQEFEAVQAVHNQGLAAHLRGDIPAALTLLDRAAERYSALGNVRHDLIIERTQVLLTAGLIDDARELCTSTLGSTERAPIRRAELLLTLAHAALAQGDAEAAEASATEAIRLFDAQLRVGWGDRARLLRLRAQYLAEHPDLLPWMVDWLDPPARSTEGRAARARRMLQDASALVESMRHHAAPELPVALLLHGRIAQDAGQADDTRRSLAAAASTRHAGPPLARAAGWLAQALLAQQRGDRRSLYLACRHGLDAVDEHRSILGDIELRALASGHGIEFTRLAVADAVRGAGPRQLLWWTERWRAAALDGSVRQPSDAALAHELAALRDVARRLESASDPGPGAPALVQERDRLETSIRQRYRHLRAVGPGASGDPPLHGPDLPAVLSELAELDAPREADELDGLDAREGGGILLYLVNDRDTLHLLTTTGGRVVHSPVGPLAVAHREAEFARFALRRAAHGRQVDLARQGRLLQDALLGERPPAAVRRLAGDGTGRPRHVVIVPPAHLLTAPWGLLPLLRDAVVTVAPSTTQWLRARRLRSSASDSARAGHVALVTGPGLTSREAEVSTLHAFHDGARVLSSDRATVAAAVAVLDGAALGHVAAHGHFRADAPLFSTLTLADGPLTVHDLHGLRRPPRSLVLSACDSGGVAPIGAYEALGLVSSLLGMGTSEVMASVVPVNDFATLAVMTRVHESAAAGATLAEGLLAARRAADDDPLQAATAASFTTWGA
ncbi:CHAT domain-containing protein [Humibacillus xanthopallidus]|uniref:CHAT domain-containing protein n=1 Tax=Humibacillus xanthopallidus TaxID=412689 RepID=UPI001FE41232|nr:CHAT domain-containing protein [Humibacillus xanthopallidus]